MSLDRRKPQCFCLPKHTMKIQKITLKNIQSHRNTVLELNPGVNVIKGRSHSGKSSVIRAIRWTAFNEPKGIDLKSWGLDKQKSSTKLDLDIDSKIERFKKGIDNGYVLNDHVFKAIRFGVPSEILEAFPFKTINFQPQSELYFLFLKSPGEVAEILNEIAGISEVDKCAKTVNTLIKETSHEVNSIKARIGRTEGQLKQLKWVDSAKSQIELLDKQIDDNTKLEKQIEKLKWDIEEIGINVELINDAEEYLKVKPKVISLKEQIQLKKKTETDITNLGHSIEKIVENQEIVDSAKELKSVKSDVEQIKDLIIESNSFAQESISLSKTIADIQLQIERQESLNKKLGLAKKEQAAILKTHSEDFCPYCGSFRTHWREV